MNKVSIRTVEDKTYHYNLDKCTRWRITERLEFVSEPVEAIFKGVVPWWLVRLLAHDGLERMTVPKAERVRCATAIAHAKNKGVVVSYDDEHMSKRV